MNDRYSGLTKLIKQPAARLLANANAELETPVAAPASAPVEVVLRELDQKGALIDIMRLLSIALPARERVWWSCLAARDLLEPGAKVPPPLAAAEAWVFKPSEENRAIAHHAVQHASMKDDTKHCAMAVQFHDGTLGPGDLAQHPAPPGGSEVSAFAMNIVAIAKSGKMLDEAADLMIERALDIARGGSGRVEAAKSKEGA
ncbi:hypothetical protein GC209_14230 [bacterium]|nr:hypothetical protein [bacterium]